MNKIEALVIEVRTIRYCFKAGVSNSNWQKGHILEKKCSAGRSSYKKSFCGPQFTNKALKISQNLSNFMLLSFIEVFAGYVFETSALKPCHTGVPRYSAGLCSKKVTRMPKPSYHCLGIIMSYFAI